MSEVRSAAAMAGVCDEWRLYQDVLRELHAADTITACAFTWMRYVAPVERSIDPDTLRNLDRAMFIRVRYLAGE